MSDRPKMLGDLLVARRKELGLSLAQTVRRCEKPISTAYLAKLEGGGVRSPSPFILHELSHALTIPYSAIMEIAGYVYPSGHEPPRDGALIGAMLQAESFAPEQTAALEAFLVDVAAACRRHFGGAGAGTPGGETT